MLNLLNANLSATIDIIALVVIIIFALYGFIEGFSKTLFTFFGTIIAIIVAVLVSSPVIKCLEENFGTVSNMANNISSPLNNLFGKGLMQTKLADVNSQTLYSAGISGIFVKIVLSVKSKGNFDANATVSDVISPTIAYYIVLIISVVILFIVLKILLKFISKMAKKAHKSKGVATIDRLFGLVLSLLYIIIVIELIVTIVGVVPFSLTQDLYASMQASKIVNTIQDLNIFGFLTDKIINTHIIDMIISTIKP
ncbi:MAG: CvpA family protein [Clostridiales bacterium]|nr:CvpA family protein [Clostridiales bacterium]